MRREQNVPLEQHALEGPVTLTPSIGLHTATTGLDAANADMEWNVQRIDMALTEFAPLPRVRMQSMIDVYRMNGGC
jgi:hypothetical protein